MTLIVYLKFANNFNIILCTILKNPEAIIIINMGTLAVVSD
jgi:hypothetical protein